MKTDRLVRVNALLKREIGEYLARVITEERDGFDRGILTVTGVETAVNLRTARVRVSFFGQAEKRDLFLGRLERHRPGLQRRLADTLTLKYTPRLHFELDTSLEEGDRVLQLLAGMESRVPPADGEGAGTEEGRA